MFSVAFLIFSTGAVLQNIPIPVLVAESLAFGGPNMDTLFVTTNSVQIVPDTGVITDDELPTHCGTLYQITG